MRKTVQFSTDRDASIAGNIASGTDIIHNGPGSLTLQGDLLNGSSIHQQDGAGPLIIHGNIAPRVSLIFSPHADSVFITRQPSTEVRNRISHALLVRPPIEHKHFGKLFIASEQFTTLDIFKPRNPLEQRLHHAVAYANTVCILGASNKPADTNHSCDYTVDLSHRYYQHGQYTKSTSRQGKVTWEYDWEYIAKASGDNFSKLHLMAREPHNKPLDDTQVSDHNKALLLDALDGIESRYGNCGMRSNIVAKYLWERSGDLIHRIEYVSMSGMEHAFIIVNRTGGALGDIAGLKGAYIIDPWFKDGLAYPAEHYTTIRPHLVRYLKSCAAFFQGSAERKPFPNPLGIVRWDIKPALNPYPRCRDSAAPHPVEYYYTLHRWPEKKGWQIISDMRRHQLKFKQVLSEMTDKFQEKPKKQRAMTSSSSVTTHSSSSSLALAHIGLIANRGEQKRRRAVAKSQNKQTNKKIKPPSPSKAQALRIRPPS